MGVDRMGDHTDRSSRRLLRTDRMRKPAACRRIVKAKGESAAIGVRQELCIHRGAKHLFN